MLRRHIFTLKQVLQPSNFYEVKDILFRYKLVSQVQRYSTKPDDERLLNHIFRLQRKDLKNISSNVWLDRINILRTYSFLDVECLEMIKRSPGILEMDLTKFKNSVKQWSCSSLEMAQFQTVIYENPVLMEVDQEVIRKRLTLLRTFCGSSALLTELLLNSPNVMLDNWYSVLAKIDYLMKVRRFSMRNIVESFALCRTLDFIKFRIDILEKCGIYKQQSLPAHKINKYDQSQHKNPSLNSILTLDEDYFSSEIAKISVEEYYVCYNLFMEEADEEDSSDDEEVSNYK